MLAALAWLVCAAGQVGGQVVTSRPEGIEGVGIDAQLGAQAPLDLEFRDDTGAAVRLKDLFGGGRPVLLSLNYSNCPMLCRVQLDALVETLKKMPWTAGQEFDVVSVSIDPLETVERARQTEQKYLDAYGRPGAGAGFHFLTGSETAIRRLADAVGFRYKWVKERQEYAHTAAAMVMTPGGVVSRYLYGVAFDPQTVRLSLVEAADGRVGSTVDQVLLFCFHYDETSGRYGPAARRLMSAGAAVAVALVAACLTPYWLRRPAPPANHHDAPASAA